MSIKTIKRRIFLKGALASQTLLVMGYPLSSIANGNGPSITPVTERISLITGLGGNVTVYNGNQGVTLVDSGSKEFSSTLLDMLEEINNSARIQTLFNTHWHDEHTGGNEVISAAGAEIIAHENTRLWLGADFHVEWRQSEHKPRPPEALPVTTFYESGDKDLGGESIQYGHFAQAHTDGDIYVFFPESNVMVTGGLLSNYTYPITDIATGGWIGGLLNANAAMLEMIDDNTVLIPDQGPPLGKADLQAQHDMLADLYEKMKALVQRGFSGHDMLEEGVTSDYDSIWGDPQEFVLETYRGMWAHTYDMGGFI